MTDHDQALLELSGVDVCYGRIQAPGRHSISASIMANWFSLLGGNASGKSTTLKTILGVVRPSKGEIRFKNQRINNLPTGRIIGKGVAIVPENRRIFPKMTVLENLEMGAYLRDDTRRIKKDLEQMLAMFPRLKERLNQQGGTLSGGEQQMLALARALMARPSLLLMDEPSMGLSPLLVENAFDLIQEVHTARHRHIHGRTERQHGPLHRRPGLCPPTRPHRPPRHGSKPAPQRYDERGLSGHRRLIPPISFPLAIIDGHSAF